MSRTKKEVKRGTGLPRFDVGDKVVRSAHPFKNKFRQTKRLALLLVVF